MGKVCGGGNYCLRDEGSFLLLCVLDKPFA